MNWRLKSKIQNAISCLPSSFSYSAYYFLQRNFGALKKTDPIGKLNSAINTCKKINEQNHIIEDRVFLEVGTGWEPITAIAYWLMGAKKIITIDLNPYLKEELLKGSMEYISSNQEKVLKLFGVRIQAERFNKLLNLIDNPQYKLSEILELCQIEYIAPGDASNTKLPIDSVDFHISYNVFEHIPCSVLREILNEGNRIVKSDGLFVHKIDYSDHFSHSDSNISSINFLQYSDEKWGKFADNRYMYMNRMRHDDFMTLFQSANQQIIHTQPEINDELYNLLSSNKFKLNDRFNLKSKDILVITGAWIITKNI